jgi:DNA-binding response OmpR family regulator
MLSVIVVEDHTELREAICRHLNRPDWSVRGVADGASLTQMVAQRAPDMLLLDLNLPGEDGLAIACRMRQEFPYIGIVMLTARAGTADRAIGYGQGADVYLTKPASIGEIESVIENLARRLESQATKVQTPRLTLDVNRQALQLGGDERARLSVSEFAIFYLLARSPNRVATAEVLIASLESLKKRSLTKRHLTLAIARLRKKLATELGLTDIVLAQHNLGYKLAQPCHMC